MERMSMEKEKRVQIVSLINSKRLLDIYFFSMKKWVIKFVECVI